MNLRIDSTDFERRIRRLAARVEDLTPVARDAAGHMVTRIRSSFQRIGPGQSSGAGQPPGTHRGNRGLLGTVTSNVHAHGEGFEVGSDSPYASVLHYGTQAALGGPIRPKKAKALTIPLNAQARRKRARDIPGLFRVPAEEGAEPEDVGILARKRGDGIEPMYALRTAVTIEPRPWLEMTDEDVDYLAEALERQIDRKVFGS